MKYLKGIPPLILLALAAITFAEPVIFTGHGEIIGPPFPTSSIALETRRDDGTPLQGVYVSLPTASSGSGLAVSVDSGGFVGHFDSSKLENYDYPGAYAQRFDGVDPGGSHDPSTVLGLLYDSSSFEALIRFDLPANSPEEHLYYSLHGQIFPDQPFTFSNVSVISSPQGYFDLNLSFSVDGAILDEPVIQMDLVGSTTPFPEPSILGVAALAALLAAARKGGYHSPRHG